MYPIARYSFSTVKIFAFYLVAASTLDSTASTDVASKDINELSASWADSNDELNQPDELSFSSDKEVHSMMGETLPRQDPTGFDNKYGQGIDLPPVGSYPPAELLAPGDKLSEKKRIQQLLKWIQNHQAMEFKRGRELGRQEAQDMRRPKRAEDESQFRGHDDRRVPPWKRSKSDTKHWREQWEELKSKHRKPRDQRVGGPPMLHTFDVKTAEGKNIKLDRENFPKAKTFLIVNTASNCSFTPQYEGLEKLHRTLKDQGLQIIAFPSNSFNLEPRSDFDIQEFVKENYDVTFPVLAKVDVNGPNTPQVFNWLKSSTVYTRSPEWFTLDDSGLQLTDVQWNFEKFLIISHNHRETIHRFSYDVKPEEITKYVEKAIFYADTMGNKKEL